MSTNNMRNKRNLMDVNTIQFSMYLKQTQEIRQLYGDKLLIGNMPLVSDPLKKNLADSVITDSNDMKPKVEPKRYIDISPTNRHTEAHTFSSISNFLNTFYNTVGAIFSRQSESPSGQYGRQENMDNQMASQCWQTSKTEVQIKNEQSDLLHYDSCSNLDKTMNIDCRSVTDECQKELDGVCSMVNKKSQLNVVTSRPCGPKNVLVESCSVEEVFEDAFSPEDCIIDSTCPNIECYPSYSCHDEQVVEAPACKVKTEVIEESMEIVKDLDLNKNKNNSDPKDLRLTQTEDIVSACDDKMNKLKLLLQSKKCKPKEEIDTQPILIPKIQSDDIVPCSSQDSDCFNEVAGKFVSSSVDSDDSFQIVFSDSPPNHSEVSHTYSCHGEQVVEAPACKVKTEEIEESIKIVKDLDLNKNKNNSQPKDLRLTKTDEVLSACDDKMNKLKSLLQSKKCKPKEEIDTQPILIPKIQSDDIVPCSSQDSDYFNEVAGKFVSSSVDSEDSFQIVFSDASPNNKRRVSDCDSEDSFIVFEDTPDNCYLSNDVFGDEIEESDSDDESSCKLSPNMSRTFSDLTDNSLYGHDEVDCANVCDSIDIEKSKTDPAHLGVLLSAKRKLEKKRLPPKKVQFSSDPPKVHVMRVWAFAARQARAGPWERNALDRERFKRRIADVEMAIFWVLKPQHRTRVVFQRFTPWWNAQNRKELAEKKLEEEKIDREREEKRNEEGQLQDTHVNERKPLEGNVSNFKNNNGDNSDIKIDNVDIIDSFGAETVFETNNGGDRKQDLDVSKEMPNDIERQSANHIYGCTNISKDTVT